MNRISTNQINNDLQYSLRRQEAKMGSMENKMATQRKIQNLRDDPIAAAHSVRYDSYIFRLNRFEQNATYVENNYRIAEGYMRQSVDILQRLRELAVQGGQGTYAKEDLGYMGTEVNELLGELINLANVRGPDGVSMFAGSKTESQAFVTAEGNVPGASGSLVTAVSYRGDISLNMSEIAEGRYIPMNQAGNEVFWAERQQVYSTFDAFDYQAKDDTSVRINGISIAIKAGDNIAAIIAKINDAGAGVKAILDPGRNSLALEGTSARQLMIEDGPGGSVLKDLGILREGDTPSNYHPTARVAGGSLFDMAIRLRDALYTGDVIEVGGAALRGIDNALGTLTTKLTELGARTERLQLSVKRFDKEIPDTTALLASEQDLDFTEAATELKMMEFAHSAALGAAGKLIQPTLLDFLN